MVTLNSCYSATLSTLCGSLMSFQPFHDFSSALYELIPTQQPNEGERRTAKENNSKVAIDITTSPKSDFRIWS